MHFSKKTTFASDFKKFIITVTGTYNLLEKMNNKLEVRACINIDHSIF